MYTSCQDKMLENHQPFYGSSWAKLGPEHGIQRWIP